MQDKVQHITSVVAYSASGSTAAIGALSLNETVMIIGMISALLTAGVNWYYKHKHYKLAASQIEQDEETRPA